jgi:hypothetical protein
MKTTIITLVSLILLVLLTTCDNKDDYMAKGAIIGWDYSECMCCGGLLINLNSDSTLQDSINRRYIDNVPENFKIDSITVFPVYIWLDYTNSDANCGQAINITRFEYR